MDFFLIWVFPALLLGGIGFFLFLVTTKHINRCKAVAGWSKTKGTVDRATVEVHKSQRFNRTLRMGYRRTYYEPNIEYSYSVLGSIFHSNGYQNFTGVYHDTSEVKAAEIVAAYPAGKSVPVTFDPNNPADAYLLPDTDTTRLGESRMIQIVVIVIAVVWFGLGLGIKVLGQVKAQNAQKQIQQSAGLLPVTSDQIAPALNSMITQYGMTCVDEGVGGKTLAYNEKRCESGALSALTAVEVYTRNEETQKVDLISAIRTPAEIGSTTAFFESVAGMAFTGADLESASAWIESALQGVIDTGSTAATTINDIPLTLSSLGQNIRFSLGELQ